MTDPNDQAFACAIEPDGSNGGPGLTKREYFAAMMCAGLCANGDVAKAGTEQGHSPRHLSLCYAESAVKQADDLIEALNKSK